MRRILSRDKMIKFYIFRFLIQAILCVKTFSCADKRKFSIYAEKNLITRSFGNFKEKEDAKVKFNLFNFQLKIKNIILGF